MLTQGFFVICLISLSIFKQTLSLNSKNCFGHYSH